MKPTFIIQGQTYHFNEIDLQSYYKLQDITKAEQTKMSEYEIVTAVTGCPTDMLKKLKFGDWMIIWDETQKVILSMNGSAFDVLPIIEHNGIKYGLPQIDQMTVGEFADLDVIVTSDNAEKKLAEIAAIVYREVRSQTKKSYTIKEYDTEGYLQRLEAFQDLPISAIKSANSFFLQCANSSLKSTVDYLLTRPELKMMDPKGQELLQELLQPDPGGEYSIPLLERILLDFTRLQDLRLEKRSTGWLGKKMRRLRQILKGKNPNIIA